MFSLTQNLFSLIIMKGSQRCASSLCCHKLRKQQLASKSFLVSSYTLDTFIPMVHSAKKDFTLACQISPQSLFSLVSLKVSKNQLIEYVLPLASWVRGIGVISPRHEASSFSSPTTFN